jgi:prepilin-type N-terminal cleavage/methylation domain-containing protein
MKIFLKQVRTWFQLRRSKSRLKIQKGFSLIELLVAITIGAIILIK